MINGPVVKLGVISDTHARTFDEIPFTIKNALTEVDLIVHAGDFTEKALLDGLKAIGKVKAVRGNINSGEVKKTLPERDIFEINGKKIGLIHGSGAPWGIAGRVRGNFGEVDIIIFGHSHMPHNQYLNGSLMFNPGRARDSYGLVTIGDEIKTDIIRV